MEEMTEASIKRVMPHNTEAEKSIISSVLIDQEAIVSAAEIVSPSDFYSPQYAGMYEAMLELSRENKAIDLITFQEKLRAKGLPEEMSDMDAIDKLLDYSATSVNIKQYAGIVKEKSILRNLIRGNDEISNSCYAAAKPVDDILERAEKQIFNIVQSRGISDYVPIDEIVMKALDRIEAASKAGGKITGLPTGFMDLDYQISGLQQSDLIIIAARPSMGKTAFALNIAEHLAFKKKETVAIFSLEMSKEQLVNRLFSLVSGVDSQALRTGNLKDAEWEQLITGADIIGSSNLIIDDTPGISISELRSKCRKYKLEKNLSVVMIDYIQLMSGGGRESRQQEISEISRALKSIARELNVPVIALSQLSRAVEKRDDKRPMLSDLRESGGIEQDADVVMFIYRDEYYTKEESKEKGIAEIIVAKQRNGPVGTVKLAWLANLTKFANSVKKDYQNPSASD